MTALFDQTVSFFERHHWPIEISKKHEGLKAKAQGANGVYDYFGHCLSNGTKLLFYVSFPLTAGAEKLREVAMLFAYANSNVILGNYDINWQDGTIRFKTVLSVDANQAVSDQQIEQLISTGVAMIDQIYPAVMTILFTGYSAEEAFKVIGVQGAKG